MSSSKEKNTRPMGVSRALVELLDAPDLSRIRALKQGDIAFLSSVLSSGSSLSDLFAAMELCENTPAREVITDADRSISLSGKVVKITVVSYLTNEPLRNAYKVSDEVFNSVRGFYEAKKYTQAVTTLQSAIDTVRANEGKTKKVVVELGELKAANANMEAASSIHKTIPAPFQSRAITTHLENGEYVAEVKGVKISGANQKLVKMVGRIVSFRRSNAKPIEDLQTLGGFTIEGGSSEVSAGTAKLSDTKKEGKGKSSVQ
ncbi:hypothetical protein [Colletotrichum fructicola RNA virus 1]|nr:hypothetical protein [Colletotrichum fructicola RNA virus 1]